MTRNGLILLGGTAFCLAVLRVFLTDMQQRSIGHWSIRVWAALDEARTRVASVRPFNMVLEDSPVVTAGATAGCFAVGFGSLFLFGFFALLGFSPFIFGVPAKTANPELFTCLFLLMAGVAIYGVFTCVWMMALALVALLSGTILTVLWSVEFVARRLAEQQKGPIAALSILVAGAIALLSALA